MLSSILKNHCCPYRRCMISNCFFSWGKGHLWLVTHEREGLIIVKVTRREQLILAIDIVFRHGR